MYSFNFKPLYSILLLATISSSVFANSAKNLDPAITKLKAHIQTQIRNKRIPGCAVAIVHRKQVIFMQAFGVKRIGKSEKINTQTLFQLGSVSKPIAASLLSILESEGLLKMDDPVHHYVNRFSLKGNRNKKNLKIKHVLSHSTGIPRAGFNNLIEAQIPYVKIRKTLQTTPLRTAVGKRYDYNNAMYGIVSDITHSASKNSFAHTLKAKLLKPLGMNQTSATLKELLNNKNKASPHVKNRRGTVVPCSTYSKGYYAVAPAGGINSTIKDMSLFLKAQLGGFPQVLKPRALQKIQKPQIPTKNMLSSSRVPKLIKNGHYALGWRVADFSRHKLVFHGGWLKGFTNFIGFVPEQDIGIVILHNGESKFSADAALQFFENYFGIQTTKKVASKKKTKKQIAPRKTKVKRKTNVSRPKIKRTTVNKRKVQRIKIKRIITPPGS